MTPNQQRFKALQVRVRVLESDLDQKVAEAIGEQTIAIIERFESIFIKIEYMFTQKQKEEFAEFINTLDEELDK